MHATQTFFHYYCWVFHVIITFILADLYNAYSVGIHVCQALSIQTLKTDSA